MSRDGSVTVPWADGNHTFRLGWKELSLLQDECDAGPYVILQRLATGAWRLKDISTPIRLGLIGGGKTPEEALRLVQAYVEARPPIEHRPLALAIVAAGVTGPEEEPLGKAPRRRGKNV